LHEFERVHAAVQVPIVEQELFRFVRSVSASQPEPEPSERQPLQTVSASHAVMAAQHADSAERHASQLSETPDVMPLLQMPPAPASPALASLLAFELELLLDSFVEDVLLLEWPPLELLDELLEFVVVLLELSPPDPPDELLLQATTRATPMNPKATADDRTIM
jgi:hypothetical protein